MMHEQKLSQEELQRIRDEREKTLADYYQKMLNYWKSRNVKNTTG